MCFSSQAYLRHLSCWNYSLLENFGGLSFMSVSVMVTVVVPDKPPMCPPMSLAWMTTRYSSLISRSIPWRATFMVAVAGDRSKPMNANAKQDCAEARTIFHCWKIWFVVSMVTRRGGHDWASPCAEITCVCLKALFLSTHLYSDWVWIMLSVLYNLEYCMQNGRYWLSHGSAYKKGSAQAYRDNPLRKQRAARSSNEYKTPHKSWALAWHPASVLSCLRQ